ncbi:T9SS type A sorting domain-containing protein [Microscilla marina]|uniref:Secretion system C-terminal sorting domain-containing protein n=1 Tax=Microscilla marina ATCC 23134 TaxID=313606 RepID=A1ZK12_MICM2|nr:T9SS type A sorting domain-containing protein [Microscilla marina]EAY29465.1 hypothetical protein M23134_01525 [Microscilla marina ATCC 23134]
MKIKLKVIIILLAILCNTVFAQDVTRDANNRITAEKYANHTIIYEYGSNGERTKRIISENTVNPLPVNLLEFTAEKSKVNLRQALLRWTTISEQNSKHFEVEHSTDVTHFTLLGKRKAAQNSDQKVLYEYLHAAPVAGTNYYRLKLVDLDGSSTYSPTRAVLFDYVNNVTIFLYPNPANTSTKLRIEGIGASDQLSLAIHSLGGEKIEARALKALPPFEYHINITKLAVGIYIVEVLVNGKRYPIRLVISR